MMSGQSGSRSRSRRRELVRNRITLEVQVGICGGLLRSGADVGAAVKVGLVGTRKGRVRANDELDW